MKSKIYNLEDGLILIELKSENEVRYIVNHKDYDISYLLLSVLLDDVVSKKFKIKDYIKTLDKEKLMDYLQELNDDSDDYLYKDNIDGII